ncbi:restriction endonuclease subunit S [Donghicola tyrosinivorans]|uniref:Uncharacterized protein n=1 Tax=Donghicola tyrosinivorans TaxID=1652492 RepID=A0A2T0WS26_9RHOB|nr:restriction endonuclease subunit S [Donghicola tyrosinivorans]PRY89501.1 hypothetical protein CLV74_106204 [Donghicola tyrosinivorans]
MEMPFEIDTSTMVGLTRLLRFAIRLREDPDDEAALNLIESRLRLEPYWPEFRGALEDYSRKLDSLHPDQKFEEICKLIYQVLPPEGRLLDDLTDDILHEVYEQRVVRFSFLPSMLLCLRFARFQTMRRKIWYHGYTIRYAGRSEDKALMACASLFLDLPIYTETGLPWLPDAILDDGEPNYEKPDYEISFPPALARPEDACELEESVRAEKLPRSIDRGKYDLESVTLNYLSMADWPATVFVTYDFLSSTKQSRLIARQRLIQFDRVTQVSQLRDSKPKIFFIRLEKSSYLNDSVYFNSSSNLNSRRREIFRFSKERVVSYEEIEEAGYSLNPSRYMIKGPAGRRDIDEITRNGFEAKKFKLSDLFEVIRPKETKNAEEGTLEIRELRAGNITPNGEIEGDFRRINIRASRQLSLEEQEIKAGDILFAHRGSIGRVAYISEADKDNIGLWAGQTLFILRERKLTSSSKSKAYCDPRVLFMYLMTPEVRRQWGYALTGVKNPCIPIGEVESLGLPENIVLPKRPRRRISSRNTKVAGSYVEQIVFEFDKWQENLLQVREIQKGMDNRLKRVWDMAWTKQIQMSDE